MSGIPAILLGRRAAVMGLGGALILLILLVDIPIVATYASQQDEREDGLHQLAVFRSEAALRPELEDELRAVNNRGKQSPDFIAADSIALAQAQLQREVKTIVENNGGEVRSVQAGALGKNGSLDIIAMQYDLTLPVSHFGALLYDIETHTPYLFIDHANIAAPTEWQNSNADPHLEIHWTIKAYRWGVR